MNKEKDFKKVLNNFAVPPDDFSAVPFWFWNDDLDEKHLLFQMREMKDKGISEFLIHSRQGRTIDYLSEVWFARVGFTLEKAKEMNVKVWLYDEDNWPSGYAGEKVLADNPDFCAKHLKRYKKNSPSDKIKVLYSDSEFDYCLCYTKWNPAYSQSFYTDLLNEDATESFLQHTHKEYYKRFESYFLDKTIKGFFVDEPGFYNNFNFYEYRDDNDSVVFTDKLPEFFKRIKGYDINEKLPLLWSSEKSAMSFKNDFYDVVTLMYTENFFGKIRDFCHSVGTLLIGHAHSEEYLPYHLTTQGDLLRVIGACDAAGVDRIDLTKEKIAEKYASSAANIYNLSRVMSETFACSGYDLNLNRIKQWTNYQYVRGINMMVPHAFFSSIEGQRQFESPPSLFYQNYYFKYFKKYSDYVKRLSYLFTEGESSFNLGIYYPITTIQELLKLDDFSSAHSFDRGFVDCAKELLENQIDFNFINDEALERGFIDGKELVINSMRLKFVLLYDLANIPLESLRVLSKFAEAGGGIVLVGKCDFNPIDYENATEFYQLKENLKNAPNVLKMNEFFFTKKYAYQFNGEEVLNFSLSKGYQDVRVHGGDADIKYMKRCFDGVDVYFFVNESKDVKSANVSIYNVGKTYKLSPYTAEYEMIESLQNKNEIYLNLSFESFGECILIVDKKNVLKPVSALKNTLKRQEAVIDKFKVSAGDFFYEGAPILWSHMGKPYYSGFMTYEANFTQKIDENRRYELDLGEVLHSAEVFINGKFVDSLVFSPFKLDITDFVKDGKNELMLKIANTTGNELYKVDFDSGLLNAVKINSY